MGNPHLIGGTIWVLAGAFFPKRGIIAMNRISSSDKLTRRRHGISGTAVAVALIVIVAIATVAYMDTITSQQSTWSPPTCAGPSKTVRVSLIAEDAQVQIADGVTYDAWTFNGTVPGPTIWVNQCETVHMTLFNKASMGHSIDFHAAEIDWSIAYATIAPGEKKTFDFVATYPGVFMYHCGTPPVLQHISNGLYGAIIVRPSTLLPQAPGGEYVLVESEFYTQKNSDGTYGGNWTKMLAATPDYVVFNGRAFQYQKSPLTVNANQLVRLYLLNVGPTLWEAFHVIGAIMDTVYVDGNPANAAHGLQTLSLPPSGGAIVDMYFRDPGGKNPFVTHSFAYASKGGVGVFTVEGGGTTTTTHSSTVIAGSVHVRIPAGAATNSKLPGFSPPTIVVVIGKNNTVVWTNDDTAPHTVTASDRSFDSGNMNPNQSFSYTFTIPGTYNYSCQYHPWMNGTVIVKQG